MKETKLLVIEGVSFLFLIFLPTIVSAYTNWEYYFYSPSALLENEWFFFALIFVAFFAFTFFALGKTMKENKMAAAVLALVISAFIAAAISQRTMFYGYVGEQIGGWLLVVAVLLALIILIKFLSGIIGGMGVLLILFAFWFILSRIDPYQLLPYSITSSEFFSIYNFLAGAGFLVLLIILTIILFIAAYSGNDEINKKIRKWLWGGRKEREIIIKG